MPSYNERLTANNQKIDDITTLANELPDADEINEKIDAQDIIIENLKLALDDKAGKGGAKLNVFTQLEEPTTKKGIWLQTDKEMEHFISDDNIFIGGTWALASETASIPFSFANSDATSIGTDIYLFGGANNKTKAYKYNTLTNTYTQLASIPYNFYYGVVEAVGTDIYLLGGADSKTSCYKYNTLTNTYTQLASIPYNFYGGAKGKAIGTDIYIFGTDEGSWYQDMKKYTYKYDTLTDTWARMSNIPSPTYNVGTSTVVGTDIYISCGQGASGDSSSYYKYNTLTNTYTQLASIPYNFYWGSTVAVGTDIYLFGSGSSGNGNKCYKYNTLTNTYTQMTNIPYSFIMGTAVSVGVNIYLLGGDSSATTNRKFYAENKSYETDNSVIVAQGRTYSVGYNVELLSTELAEEDFQPLYGFADAWFYTLQDGLETDIPTYYGNGTQWINIKNPPQEEQEGSED